MNSGLTIRSLGLATIGYAVGSALGRIASLLLVPVYTAVLQSAELGLIATLQMFATIATPIVTLGIGSALGICYFARSEESERDRVVSTSSAVVLISAALLVAAGLFAHRFIGNALLRTDAHDYAVGMTLVSVAIGALSMPLALRMQFRRSIVRYIAISLVGATFALALGIALVAVAGRGIDGAIEAQVVAQLIGLIGFVLASRGVGWLQFDPRIARELIVHGLPLVPSFLFLLILQQGGQFILLHLRGMSELGAYSVAYSLGLSLSIVVAAFTTAWMPHFHSYSDRPAEAIAQLGRPMMWYAVGFGALAALAFVWSRPLMCVLVAEPFPVNPRVFGLTAAAQVLIGAFALLLPPLYFAHRVWVATVVQGIAAITSLAVAWVLIDLWGDDGAATGHVLGMTLAAFLMLLWIRLRPNRYLQIRYPWMRILIASASFALISLAACFDRQIGCGPEWLISIAGTALTGAVALGVLHADDRQIVRRIVQSCFVRLLPRKS